MDHLLINAEYNEEFELSEETLDYCKKYKTIALYAAIQFSQKLNKIIEQLKSSGINVITSQPERTHSQYQILGCDLSYKNLKLEAKPNAFLYIGDGLFHPRALALSQKEEIEFKKVDEEKVKKILVSHDFSVNRIDSGLKKLKEVEESKKQTSLSDFI